MAESSDELKKSNEEAKELNQNIQDATISAGELLGAFSGILNEIKGSNYAITESNKAFRGLFDISFKLKLNEEGIEKLSKKQLESLEIQAKKERIRLELVKGELENRGQLTKKEQLQLDNINGTLKDKEGLLDEINKQIETAVVLEEQEFNNIKLGTHALSAMDEALNKMGLGKLGRALGTSELSEKFKELDKERAKFPEYKKAFIENFNKPAVRAAVRFVALGFIIKELGDAFLKVNKETVELQKGMALSANEAATFRSNISTVAKQSGNINITASKLLETFSNLNKQFGFITNFSSETLVTMTKLTKVVGTSSESAGNLAAASAITGTNFESNYKNVLATSYELQRQEGVQMDLRDILEQTGKVTGTIRANLGANPENIAKAVTQAKLFGASLEQVANAGKSFLQFESSITSELEAELLLGKNINLERARLAALNGDQVTLAKELREQAGDYEDFMKMNVIQQEAIAKAMGMQSDQLADILFQQDIQGKTAKELRALGKDELADRLEAQTVQDKFNASMEKLKELFADVATALMPVFEFMGQIFGLIGKVIKVLEPFIGTIGGAIAGFLISGNPIGAIVGGIIGAGSDISRAVRKTGDLAIDPNGGPIVASPQEGTLYQGTINDGVSMSPYHGISKGSTPQPSSNTLVKEQPNDLAIEQRKTNQMLAEILNSQKSVGTDQILISGLRTTYQIS